MPAVGPHIRSVHRVRARCVYLVDATPLAVARFFAVDAARNRSSNAVGRRTNCDGHGSANFDCSTIVKPDGYGVFQLVAVTRRLGELHTRRRSASVRRHMGARWRTSSG